MTIKSFITANAKTRSLNALPGFVVESFPKFVAFLRAYYEWEATKGADAALESMKLNNDIDFIVDDLIPSHKNQFGRLLPEEIKSDYRHFAKFLSFLYSIKGTEDSYKILIRALYNAASEIVYPKIRMAEPSASYWLTEYELRVSSTDDLYEIEGSEITGKVSGAKAMVIRVFKRGSDYILFLEDIRGVFDPSENIVSEDGKEGLILPVYQIDSFTSGQGWKDNDNVRDGDIILKVDQINYGKIVDLTIENPGIGYQVDDTIDAESASQGFGFRAVVTGVGANGEITGLKITRYGLGYDTDDVTVTVHSKTGTGAILKPIFDTEFSKVKSLSIIQNDHYIHAGAFVSNPDPNLQISYSPVAVFKHGRFVRKKGTASSRDGVIHDSDYYQNFSYEVRSSADLSPVEELLKNLFHVAGLKMFTARQITETRQNTFETIDFSYG